MSGIASLIRERHSEIMECWTAEASRAAAARGLDKPALQNILPHYLTALGDAKDDLGRFGGTRRELIDTHFASRIRQGFSLPEMVEEIAVLGRCIADCWQTLEPSAQPSNREIEALFRDMHLASVAMAEMFNQHMLDDEQTEKRYLRQIRSIATAAVQMQAEALPAQLEQVLLLIMEAMGAQCAALLLFNPGTQDLDLAASVGVAREDLRKSVSTLGLSSFAGQIAANESATQLGDAETTELEVPAQLRKSGIHALLGVRLPERHTLVGVIYVGAEGRRTFSRRDIRRLESLGESLTLHLDNVRLHALARERVEALEEERKLREHFVSVLAHDLRGPLSAARMNAQLLISHPERLDARRDLATKIDRGIERTDGMIRDLLDANRLRAGQRLPLHIIACDLGALARESAAELTASFGPWFVVDAAENVAGFWGADELRRALWNLASNAVKYGESGTPITITAKHMGDGGALLSVHNSGAVISPEDQKNLFLPFTRTRSAEAGGQQGWGLGLALVRGCAEAHGGSVDVSSTPEAGTTFTIALPLDARPHQKGPPTMATEHHGAAADR